MAVSRSCLGLLLIAFLAMALMETSVDARSHKARHRVQRRNAEPELKEDGDDYLQSDGGYYGDFSNDADDDDGEGDEGDEDDSSEGDDGPILPPIIISKPQNFTVNEGGSIWLPCDAKNTDGSVATWRKGDQVFYQGHIQITNDPRIIKYTNMTLSISNLGKSDAGQYSCSFLGSSSPPTLFHEVTLATAPKIYHISPNGTKRLVVEGNSLKIQCHTSGHPTPTISWSKNGERLTNVEYGHQSIFIKHVTRADSGMYQCLASNGIGEDHGAVDIKVLHAPEVRIKESVINTGEGYEAVLFCSVHSEPRATIYWERNGVIMKDTTHHPITLGQNGEHSKLRIIRVNGADFGEYHCKANNQYGESSGRITLSKQPGRAMWIAGPLSSENNSPILQWAVESVQPLKDVEIKYIKVDESKPEYAPKEEEWIVVKPDIKEPNGNIYTVRHTLQNLQPGKYAAILRSQNDHGWSEMSELKTFDGDYESNEIRADESLQEAPAAEIATGGASNLQYSLHFTAAKLLLSMITVSLVTTY